MPNRTLRPGMYEMKPHIIVCIKAVVVKSPRGRIVRTPDNVRLNPFDLPAIESALQLRSQVGGSITVLSMGPLSCRIVMAEALAMGADRAVLVSDFSLMGADTLATSTTLSAAIQKLAPCELVLFGSRSADSDTGQVGPQTAVALNLPLVTGVHRIETRPAGLCVVRTLDERLETSEVDFPAALTIRPDAARPRDIALGDLSQAFDQGTVELVTCAELSLSPERVGEAGSPTRVLSMQPIANERRCRFLKGSSAEMANQLMDHLAIKGLID